MATSLSRCSNNDTRTCPAHRVFTQSDGCKSELGADAENTKFHAIHQTGKPDTSASLSNAVSNGVPTESSEGASRPPRPRPLLVRFVSRMDSNWAWENRKKLTNSSHFSSVFINKDLFAESAKQRGNLGATFRKAAELNIGKLFIKRTHLLVNSTVYSVDNLPDYLLPR